MSADTPEEEVDCLFCWKDESRVCGAGCVAYSHDKQQTPTHCLLLITPARININLSRIHDALRNG